MSRPPTGSSTLRLPAGRWGTVLDCLCAHFAWVTRAQWLTRFEAGRVLDASFRPIDAAHAYHPGLTIHYFREVDDEPRIPFSESLVHVDAHLVIADKPHFLPVTPAGRFVRETLLARLITRLGNPDLVPLHRIDRGTAGLVMFSADATTRSLYQALFRTGAIQKTYEAIAPYLPDLRLPHRRESRIVRGEPFFRMREIEGMANTRTCIDAVTPIATTELPQLARYRLRPETGRKHQLRVHMAALGAPIVGDTFYPHIDAKQLPHAREPGNWTAPDDDFTKPLRLLARALTFVDPRTGEQRHFTSALPL